MRLILALSMILAAAAARAEEAGTPLTPLQTTDQGRAWEAVGRLNIGTRGFCTAALIAPDRVLTAAHCLYDPTTGRPLDLGRMSFLAGWRNGRAEAYRNIRRAVAHPGFVYDDRNRATRVSYDLALLELDRPIRLPQVQPLATGAAPKDGDVGVVSYAQDRAEAPSLQQLCHILGREQGVLILSCDVDFGSSGAPVFDEGASPPRIVSVISAKAELDRGKVALGSDLAGQIAVLTAAFETGASPLRPGPAPGQSMNAAGGAKFVRP